jgi:endonuclease-8
MAEGDTIFRTAEMLRPLVGQRVSAARAQAGPGLRRVPDLSRLVGATVTSVEARGKHLLISFDNGLTMRSHLRMTGSWHRFRKGEAWPRPLRQATAIVETSESVAVAFNTPVIELLTDADLRRSRPLATLGPDLLAASFDADEVLRRMGERRAVQLGDALLDQRAVAGIGNVYKSEVAFLSGLDPWAPVGAFTEDELRRALDLARRMLQANARHPGPRVTTGRLDRGGALWVYGRAGHACRRCGTAINSRRQGELARLTYWCPRCQPARATRAGRPPAMASS